MGDNTGDLVVPEPEPEEREKSTTEFLEGIKEREVLKNNLENTTRELNKVKGQNYDLLNKIESLEKQIKELTDNLNSKKQSRPGSSRLRKTSNAKKRPVKRKEPKKQKNGKNNLSPHSAGANDDPFETSEKLYEAIAGKYPELALSTVLTAEKKFAEADVNNDGTIDAGELEKLLDSSDLLFTKKQVEEILGKLDADETGSVDFFECLAVLDQLRANRKTGLPKSLQDNKSAVCCLQ